MRSGYTTGACAAAAARGAALMLRDQRDVSEVTIRLPAGIPATFRLGGRRFSPDTAACFVVKDAGDDPDITNGAEIHALVTIDPALFAPEDCKESLLITGGTGIGRATKPGLAVAPGEWAINPVPRRMISESVSEVLGDRPSMVRISIPDGESRAKKTLNGRLGIVGGLSILGTTGIVRPVSAKAWTDTIDSSLDVARACGCGMVVFSTGRTSELAAQDWFRVQGAGFRAESQPTDREPATLNPEPLPEEAYVMMGDHVAHAVRSARERGFTQPVIACQFAKLLKIACGYENTHAAASEMDLGLLLQWIAAGSLPPELIEAVSRAATAREIALNTAFNPTLMALVAGKALQAIGNHAPGLKPFFMVADYTGRVIFSTLSP